MMTLDEVKERFAADRFAVQVTGIEITEVGEHYAKCALRIEDKHLAAHNHVMGGVIYTLADFAFAVAANKDGRFTVTVNSNISYMDQPKGEMLFADCYCVKDGGKLCYYETEIRDETGRPVASITTTGMHF